MNWSVKLNDEKEICVSYPINPFPYFQLPEANELQ
jgi:hypothetical protein